MNKKILGRTAEAIDPHLRGAYVLVRGKVIIIREGRFLLSPVYLSGKIYDHVWLIANEEMKLATVGDTLEVFTRLSVYGKDEIKWCCRFPYLYVKVIPISDT